MAKAEPEDQTSVEYLGPRQASSTVRRLGIVTRQDPIQMPKAAVVSDADERFASRAANSSFSLLVVFALSAVSSSFLIAASRARSATELPHDVDAEQDGGALPEQGEAL